MQEAVGQSVGILRPMFPGSDKLVVDVDGVMEPAEKYTSDRFATTSIDGVTYVIPRTAKDSAGASVEEGPAASAGRVLGYAIPGMHGSAAMPSKVRQPATGEVVGAVAKNLDISNPAARAVHEAIRSEDLPAAAARLQRAGPNAMLGEGGPALQALTDATAASGGEATRIVREATDARVARGTADARGAIDEAFKPGTAVIPQPPKIGTLYDVAYAKPIDYASEPGRVIESAMKRVPQSVKARARALIEMDSSIPEEVKQQYLISIQPDGSSKIGQLPSVLEVDWTTRALNDVAKVGDGKGALGGNTNEGRIYGNLSRILRDATKAAVPEYRSALEAAGTEIGIRTAREFGSTVLRRNVTRRDVAEMLDGMPEAERLAAKGSVREAIEDSIANVRRTMSRPGTDAGEAVKAIQDLSSTAAREKLGFILGKEQAAALADKLDEAGTAFEIAAALHQNSKTAVRGAVQGSVDASTAPGVMRRVLAGEPLQATKRLAQIITGSTPEAREAAKAGIYAEIAKALTQTKGRDAEHALMGIAKAMSGQEIGEAQALRIAKRTVFALNVLRLQAPEATSSPQSQPREPAPAFGSPRP
jgi:hypothetical protein